MLDIGYIEITQPSQQVFHIRAVLNFLYSSVKRRIMIVLIFYKCIASIHSKKLQSFIIFKRIKYFKVFKNNRNSLNYNTKSIYIIHAIIVTNYSHKSRIQNKRITSNLQDNLKSFYYS